MEVITITKETVNDKIFNDIKTFCLTVEKEKSKPAWENMSFTDWENKPQTLLYVLLKTNRFNSGSGVFSFLYKDNIIVASSGAYISDFDSHVIIGGVRAWKLSSLRGGYFISKNIMPIHEQWAKTHNGKIFALTFNEYNFELMQKMNRSGQWERARKSKFLFGSLRDTYYQDMNVLPYTVNIQNTTQHVLYKRFDESYEPAWPRIC